MYGMSIFLVILLTFVHWSTCLLPAKFQWKTIDFAWEGDTRSKAIKQGSFVPENNMPTGLAVWRDKVFITIPRWKKGVPASLNYVMLNGSQQQPLHPYPSWHDAYTSDASCCVSTDSTVISAFRVTVDSCNRLWTVDNGVTDMASEVKQISDPAIFIFNLENDTLIQKYVLENDVLKDSSVLTSIAIERTAHLMISGHYGPWTPNRTVQYIINLLNVRTCVEGDLDRLAHLFFPYILGPYI